MATTIPTHDRRTTSSREAKRSGFQLAPALLLGLLVRLRYVAAGGFPMGDGGLFYTMIHELQRHR